MIKIFKKFLLFLFLFITITFFLALVEAAEIEVTTQPETLTSQQTNTPNSEKTEIYNGDLYLIR